MTKSRLTTALFCVLYIAVACCFGLIHNHSDAHQHCAACAWLLNTVADAPAPVVHHLPASVARTVAMPAAVVIVAPVFCNTGSRAPPLASA